MRKEIDLRDPILIQADIFDRWGWEMEAFTTRMAYVKKKRNKGERVIDDSVSDWFQFGKEKK